MAKLKLYIIKKLIRSFRQGATITAACKIAGIARETYYDWIHRQWPALGAHFEEVKVLARVEAVEDALYASAVSGDVNAQKNFLLNRKKSWRLGDPKEGIKVVQQTNVTQGAPAAQKESSDELERAQDNVRLIRKFGLLDKYGSPEGQGPVPVVCPEGQQRDEGQQRADT